MARGLAVGLLLGGVKRRPRDAAWLAAWSLVEASPAIVSGWAIAEATGNFLAGRIWHGAGWLGLILITAGAGAAAARPAYRRLAALVEPVRDNLIRLIVTGALRPAALDVKQDTGAVARITHQAEIVRDTFAGLLTAARTFAFTAGGALVGLLTLIPATLPLVLPPVAVSLLLLHSLLRPLAARQRRSLLGEEDVADSAGAAIAGLRDAIACGAEDQLTAEITSRVEQQAAAARSLARVGAARVLCLAVGGLLPLVLVLAAAPSLLHAGVTPGAIIGAVAYIGGSLRGALSTLTEGLAGSGVRLAITLARIMEASGRPDGATALALHDGVSAPSPGPAYAAATPAGAPASAKSALCPGSTSPGFAGTGHGGLMLRRVSFRYGPQAEPVIRNLSIDIPHGDHLAIAGPSGIGKSTLAALMAGLLTPSTGEIRIDGMPLRLVPLQSLPLLRVLNPQEAYVFAGTLEENLAYLNPAAPASALDTAVDAVGLRPLVSRLNGYRAEVNPQALSAGERQLIALARAYLSPAPVAILDEATCHLDPVAEARAERAFAAREGTLIIVAHRVSSAIRARRILVLDGTRAQIGEHAELLATSTMYRDLVGHWQGATERPGGALRVG